MDFLLLKFFLPLWGLLSIVSSLPVDLQRIFIEWNTCPREYHSLHNTCGESYIKFMSAVEKRSMEVPEFLDPSRCLDGRYDVINEVDFIVIGAGLAGSMVAGRLSEVRDWEVLILEEGDAAPSASQIPSMYFNYLRNPKYDYMYELLPQNNACLNSNGICVYPRGKVMGGTATIHGMMYMRGNRADYDLLKQDGIDGWSYDEVFPYFLKSEDNKEINRPDLGIEADKHGRGGPMQISRFADQPPFADDLLKGYQELGYNINIDLNGESQRGFMIAQATNRNGSRLNSARAYLYDNLNTRSNLYVQPNSKVTRILIDPRTMTAEGVIYEHRGVRRFVKARKEVILSAGTIASPQLLMLSGIGPKKHLEDVGISVMKDLPGVGENLNNHVSTEIFFRIGTEDNSQPLHQKSADDFFNFRTGPMTSTGLSQVTGFLWTDYSLNEPRPDLQIFHAGFMANCSKTGVLGEPLPGVNNRMFSISPTVLNARSVGWVKLKNRYPESAPLIWGNILGEKHDMDVLLAGIRATQRLTQTPTMIKRKVTLDTTMMPGCEHEWWNTEGYWRCYIAHRTNPENHQTGTCKMGAPTDPMAVLDSKLRVYGIKHLRVADASVFPRSPSANLQGPTMMVAERAADFIKETWKSPYLKYW